MTGHQAICVKAEIVLNQCFFQSMQIAEIIFLSKEAWFAVVPALHDVQGAP